MTDFSKKFSPRIQNLYMNKFQRSSVALMIEINHTCQDASTRSHQPVSRVKYKSVLVLRMRPKHGH